MVRHFVGATIMFSINVSLSAQQGKRACKVAFEEEKMFRNNNLKIFW